MFYIVYQTTNLLDGKIYIGCHRAETLYDEYLGSGKYLKRAIEKHGKSNFKRQNIHVFTSETQMFDKEAEIVNEEFVKRQDTYNFKIGGFGGWDHINSKPKPPVSNETRKRMSASAKIRQTGETNSFYGKTHTKETKLEIGKKSKKTALKHYDRLVKEGKHPNSVAKCPHCHKEGQMRAMKRWHFDNCKFKS